MPFERIPSGTPRSHAFGRTLLAMGLRRRSSRATTASITATTAVKAVARDTPAEFTCFLIKVASRCNLACDYCYMYEHADQSWRDQPRVISDETVQALASRIAEYVSVARLERVLVVLHGGELLLVGADRLAGIGAQIRAAVGTETLVDVSIQTNGLLLDSVSLARLASEEISVSLSIDGPTSRSGPTQADNPRPLKLRPDAGGAGASAGEPSELRGCDRRRGPRSPGRRPVQVL